VCVTLSVWVGVCVSLCVVCVSIYVCELVYVRVRVCGVCGGCTCVCVCVCTYVYGRV
jgi:hypothetical protein